MKDHISEEEKRIEPNRHIPFCFSVTCVFFYFNCPLQNKVAKANATQRVFSSLFFSPELDFVPPPKKNLRGKFFVQLFYFKKVALGKASKDNDRILPPNS